MNDLTLRDYEIAKMFGISTRKVNQILKSKGLQYYINKRWHPTELGCNYCSGYQQRVWGMSLNWDFKFIRHIFKKESIKESNSESKNEVKL